MSEQLKPLGGVLDGVIDRLAAVERRLGIVPPSSSSSSSSSSPSSAAAASAAVVVVDDDVVHPRLVAYDEHVSRALVPFVSACASLGSEMGGVGKRVEDVWRGMRLLIELGTTYRRPTTIDVASALLPHLAPCRDAMSNIQKSRLDRKYDTHLKAINEMLACVSWVVLSVPPSPASFVKDTLGSSDFWSNKIRKEYRGKGNDDERQHVGFCDAMRALILDLSCYLKEHHLSGLAWNPHGMDFEDAVVGKVGGKEGGGVAGVVASTSTSSASSSGGVGGGGGDVLAELMKKKTEDGSSAATGLRKVAREQQTWRKEYKKDDAVVVGTTTAASSVVPAAKFGTRGHTPSGPPKCEYQERGCKWIIENQTSETCDGGVCDVTVTDAKQQVYVYNCVNVTVRITGKVKSIVLDGCVRSGVIFDAVISACEVVNCKSVQVQATDVCPSFSIDKTDGIVVHLTGNGAIDRTVFVTSKSSEMNGEVHRSILFLMRLRFCCVMPFVFSEFNLASSHIPNRSELGG
jgi:adenylyl cyclase-associated protein